jgi:integrase
MWAQKLVTTKRGPLTVSNVWITGANIVFAWALKHKHIQANPFAGVEIDVPKKVTLRETPAFTRAETRTILQAALRIEDMTSAMMRAKRWVLWICAYSGARAGEIVQLRGKDITKRGRFYVMRLTPEAGTIKTDKARIVPIHEHIVAQGFIDFVKATGNGPLFYNARAANAEKADPLNPKPHPSDKTRQRLGAWVRKLGVDDPEVLPTHGWRHTFKQTADRVGITEKVSHAITGHAPTNIGQSYGAPTVEDMAKALKKFPRYVV